MQPESSHRSFNKSALNMSAGPLEALSRHYKVIPSPIKEFQDIFLYGTSMKILHKGRAKEMYIYLDNNRETFLWISSKTKAFIIDLYFAEVQACESDPKHRNKLEHYIILRQFEDQVVFIFDTIAEKNKLFNLLTVYIDTIRKGNSKYTEYFSLITRTYALESTKNGSTSRSEKDILEISSRIGLVNKRQNEKVLRECCKFHRVKNMHEVPFDCVSQYFKIQFCSRSLQKYFEEYSREKLGSISDNPRLILKEIMSVEEFKYFLRKQQKESEQFIEQICEDTQALSFFDFCLYLYDQKFCSISSPPKLNENYPLTNYFCFSSHNTYLSGNQLTSDSKVERYTQDLERGIKCVELDVHNDGNTPIITHAVKDTSLCSSVLFSDVIKEIDRFSEQCRMQNINHYPIILSIQNHASDLNREKMLNTLVKHFHDSLYLIDGKEEDFPTLNELRGKIVIKTSSKQSQLKKVQNMKQTQLCPPPSQPINLPSWKNSYKLSSQFEEKMNNFMKYRDTMIERKEKFDEQIVSIENLFLPISSMTKITSIFKAPEGIKTVNVTPFSCTSMTNSKVLKTDLEEIVRYSSKSWLRTYPQGTEIGSSNYDPIPMLKAGAQIIALNTQTKDDYAWMMYGYFCGGRDRTPGSLGYVLKPSKLLPNSKIQQKPKKVNITLKIIQKGMHKIKIRFMGFEEDKKKTEVNGDTFVAQGIENLDESFLIFDMDEKYRDCVALRFIAAGFRILEGRNIQTFLDCGIRIIINVNIEMV